MIPAGTGPVAIVAGSGRLPALVARALDDAGREKRILAIRGFADRDLVRRADAVVDLLDIERALKCLDAWRPICVTLAGAVSRPSPLAVLNALAALRNKRELAELMARGDDHVLRGVVALLEERGHRVLGAHDLAPDLMAASGTIGARVPSADSLRSIAIGLRCLSVLSPYDIGQALVVEGERVTAIEGAEGTDRMLARVRSLKPGALSRTISRLPGLRSRRGNVSGILVKSAKCGQDLRVDLPTIGPRTVAAAARAGLSGIAIGAGRTLVVDREAVAAEADRRGLFLVAVEPEA